MNSDFMRWLLNVKAIPKDSEGLRVAWEHPWPSWVWALLFIAGGLFAVWSYSKLAGNRTGRGILAITRFALIVLMLIFISGPMLQLPRETLEQDWVLMLADRSASMTIKDAPASDSNPASTQRVSRDEQLQSALQANKETFSNLAAHRNVVWLGFHAGAFNLQENQAESGNDRDSGAVGTDAQPAPIPMLRDPEGRRSDLESALQQAMQRAAARPVSGVVIFSDGRADSVPSRSIVRRLTDEQIRVIVVPLGSPEPVGDLAIRSVEAPSRAFVRDKVPVIVEIEARGLDASRVGPTQVRLVDQLSGEVLDVQEIDPQMLTRSAPGSGLQVTLTAQPSLAGETTWVAEVASAGAHADFQSGAGDLIPENNTRALQIELIDRPLRVLYVEGYPRWEYRYVKNLMVREKTIESSVMLISADRDFAQEGNQPITRLPRSPEEFAQFDVIILGDVPATFFSPPQLDMIRAHIADRGAGLLWIAGPRSLPNTYSGTALADLLPMRGNLKLPPIGEPVTMASTPLAQRLGVLQLEVPGASSSHVETFDVNGRSAVGAGWPQELMDPATGWSRLFYAQRIEPGLIKPATEVLAQTVHAYSGSNLPLVMNMRYGAGQSIYVATDEIWRWRYGRGELLPDQFWLQMIRMLGRESLTSGGEPAIVEVNPRRVAINQPLRIQVRLLDAQLLQQPRATIRVALDNEDGQRVAELELQRVEGSDDRFAATYLPDQPGNLRVRIDDSTMPTVRMQASAEIYAPDDELQRPETDHDLLASLASATGGKVITPDELSQLPNLLPNRSVKTINPLSEPIWDSPLAFILALLAITCEWIGRKILRLV